MRESLVSKKTFADLVSVFFASKRGGACRITIEKDGHENNKNLKTFKNPQQPYKIVRLLSCKAMERLKKLL